MSRLIPLLIALPLASGLLLLAARGPRLRAAVVGASAALLIGGALLAVALLGGRDLFFDLPAGLALPGRVLLAADGAIALFVAVLALRHHRPAALVLALLGLAASAWLELPGAAEAAPGRLFHVDRLALVLVAIAGVIGPLICVHALGYLPGWHQRHAGARGRPPVFFFLLFLFLAAMIGLVVANHLPLLFLFWELTTLCSFLLIGYAGTAEAIGFAFDALEVNLLGGLAFALAQVWLVRTPARLDLAALSATGGGAALPALALLALAALTKSAQFPFSGWLLGAMHAPAPTSALLHSSTMVKAGVFLLLRLSPALGGTPVGQGLVLLGLISFLGAALVATTEQDAKRVLAFSTISNLGLAVACAGAASPEALWVGVLLIVFHAAAKGLLFLTLGTVENRLGTRDVEALDHLLSRLPRVSALALAGIAGMFLAPFGVVIAKWSAIRAFLAVPGWLGAVSLLLLAFGSACTLFYWAKLLFKIVSVRTLPPEERALEEQVPRAEWVAGWALAALVVGLAAGVDGLSSAVATPIALGAFAAPARVLFHLGPGLAAALVAAVLALPVLALRQRAAGGDDPADIYVSGRTADAGHTVGAALGGFQETSQRNYYLDAVVDGPRAFRASTGLCALVLGALLVLSALVRP